MVAAPLAGRTWRSVPASIVANFFGRGVVALLGLLCAPIYLHYLGTEGYGVVGIYLTLQNVLALLDMGMGPAVTRALAQGLASHAEPVRLRSLLRTLEAFYFAVGMVAACALFLAAPFIAAHWVKPQQLSVEEVATSVRLMAAGIACSWITPLYSGALGGLHAQVELNIVVGIGAVLRWGGAALVLMFGWPTSVAFFAWQIVAGASQSIALFLLVWRTMPVGGRARFDPGTLEKIWRFAAGVTTFLQAAPSRPHYPAWHRLTTSSASRSRPRAP